ncbi:hypothetical protein D8M04_09250 [Oceanobacillus piezotolerans]|uniref:Lipoprotein n=1 Tax=Oceanobacillus piezotolerans TaxID=2448030 RepID=A0A498D5V2_9BACI|nr:hypothetical protein [Oceanobacillus piezotolerans]RLL45049.1 hypothetical protein D8M04_09250 [Oceanobacillus piezotolerans]
MKHFISILLIGMILVGCGNSEVTENAGESSGKEPFLEMRNIHLQVEEMEVNVTAEVSTEEDYIYYSIAQGEEVLVKEKRIEGVREDSPWTSIEIEERLKDITSTKENIPVLSIYVKNEAGEAINPNYIPIYPEVE